MFYKTKLDRNNESDTSLVGERVTAWTALQETKALLGKRITSFGDNRPCASRRPVYPNG